MSEYIISCESTSDLKKEVYEQYDLNYICFHFSLNGVEYLDDLGQSVPFDQFYKRMANGEITKTSQISTGEYVEYFEKFLKEGKDILHVTLSSGISGTINSANAAVEVLKEKYPDRKIYVVDSLGASSGYGLLMVKLAEKKKEGLSLEELKEFAEANKLLVNHWFFSTDLKYYVRGGRISKASGFFGTLLKICPLLNMDDKGRLIPREKIRTVKRVEIATVEKMVKYAKDGINYSGKCFISNAGCPDFAADVKKMIEEKFHNLDGEVQIFSVGTTIGSHTGPGTLALFFIGEERKN